MKNKVLNWLKTKKDNLHSDGDPCKVQLIEGVFEPSESADVLLSLLNYKIKFHTVQLLNLQKKEQEKDLEKSRKRIEELKIAKKKVTDLVIDAQCKGLSLDIHSIISITLKSRTDIS